MTAKYITNAFSMQMVEPSDYMVKVSQVGKDIFDLFKDDVPSAVGHKDTAAVLGVECNRINVSLKKGDSIIVAQLQGGRLPEGATTLPEGFTFKYFWVDIL